MLPAARHIEQQRARRDAFAAENLNRRARNRGASFGGLDIPLLPIPTERDMVAAAEASAQREAAYKASPAGTLFEAICAARTALREALMQLEAVDTARMREDGSIGCAADRLVLATRPVLSAALDVSLAASEVL